MSPVHRCDLHKIARECGVKLFDGRLHSPSSRRARECYAKPTARAIGRQYGEAHLRLVWILMTGTEANACQLYADAMRAVSHLLARRPELQKRPNLIDEFDIIDLGELRLKVKDMHLGIECWKQLASLLAAQFYDLNMKEAA